MPENASDLFAVTGYVSAFSAGGWKRVCVQNEAHAPGPVPAYQDQPLTEFDLGLQLYQARRSAQDSVISLPHTGLMLFTLHNARFVINPGLDGMIIDQRNRMVSEPSCFCQHDIYRHTHTLPDMPVHEELDEVFIGFDNAFRNYYHWLLYGISKTQLANTLLPPSVTLAMPEQGLTFARRNPAYSSDIFEKSLALSGLSDRVAYLDEGLHRARTLHFFWHAPTMPELYMNLNEPYALFDGMKAPPQPDLPKRIYISREGGHDRRITPEEQAQIDPVLTANGFEKVFLEKLDFESQLALFRQAEAIIAPHGAGLANLVFIQPGVKVIELNRQLDGQPHLRNCFDLIAQKRRARYCVFNLHTETLTSAKLQNALDNLDAAPVPAPPPAPQEEA
ncbi:hypothetical protein ACI01nite_06170 [Acetobacter cibinongensis]|uniref:Glycosyltransferase 61 catalytic domain-containing protein n=1 Tax=Acetobacter cibinongensis TaxID=146475 RepID=A0A0D6N473_9PROT|nr:glycosyltransferase family 61 protein [Acetobacter cibinongensis]GAN60311.1 hypothetical protein Abci_011_041 [Acetobacter cibinongensis]GBQ18887.1 hypothetical protein AA0482_2398 [Acetobacter cibinongensis NRIC 0482]GEL58015.1 hypothetical protein ACI01nite_06170 [Acetobacter cibinongensis]